VSKASEDTAEDVTHRPCNSRAAKRVGRRERLSPERSLKDPKTVLLKEGKRAEIKAE
jgi:hypothetical protein